MKYITRSLEKVVMEVTQEYPVVLVTGPRQVGKTTMLQKLMDGTGRGYVSLDDLTERDLAKRDPELFLQLHRPPVLADRFPNFQANAWRAGISGRKGRRSLDDYIVSGRG